MTRPLHQLSERCRVECYYHRVAERAVCGYVFSLTTGFSWKVIGPSNAE
jgi:hypothetical protein